MMFFVRNLTNQLGSLFVGLSFSALLCVSYTAYAADKVEKTVKKIEAVATTGDISPDKVVENATTKLMSSIEKGRALLKTDPEAYYREVNTYLNDAVNFKFISRNVMGKYGKQASKEQRAQFEKVFTKSLVETYAKGMSTFSNLDIKVQPMAKAVPPYGKVEVMQKIKGLAIDNHVSYSMGKRKGGQWQIINVVLNGVNLGLTFRSQFSQAVKDNKGDIDAAIRSWSF